MVFQTSVVTKFKHQSYSRKSIKQYGLRFCVIIYAGYKLSKMVQFLLVHPVFISCVKLWVSTFNKRKWSTMHSALSFPFCQHSHKHSHGNPARKPICFSWMFVISMASMYQWESKWIEFKISPALLYAAQRSEARHFLPLCPFVCHTHELHLNGSRYLSIFHTV